MPLRTFTTAGVNNLWSNVANWDTGVPANTDTFLIPLGQTAEFDVDQSGFAAGIAGTVTGTLTLTATAGTYYFKQNGAVVGTGSITAGSAVTPLAFAAKHTWDLNGQVIGSAGGGPLMSIYCTNPTNRYISLSAAEAAGQTILSVDTDVTGDIWAVADTVVLTDYTLTRDIETAVIAAGGIAAGTITVTAGIGAAKVQYCRMYLLTRHIRFINAPVANAFYTIQSGSYIRAEVSGGGTGTVFRVCATCTFDGVAYAAVTATQTFTGGQSTGITLSGIVIASAAAGWLMGSNAGTTATSYGLVVTSTGILTGSTYMMQGAAPGAGGMTISTRIQGELWQGATSLINNFNNVTCVGAKFTMTPLALFDVNGLYLDGCTFTACTTALKSCARVMACNCTTTGGTTDLDCVAGEFFNCTFGSATEHANYNLLEPWMFTGSEQHDATAGAFVGWSKGGVCVSNVVTVPTGYTRSFQHLYESATLWNLRQYHTVVQPGAKLTVSAWLRKDLLIATAGNRPTVQIIDVMNDPLVDTGNVALASATMGDTVNTWENLSINWTNPNAYQMNVLIRILSRDVGGGPNYFYENASIQFTGGGMGGGGATYLDATI